MTDRRQQHQPFHIHRILGRRRQARRQLPYENCQIAHIDTHPPTHFALIFGILALCFADAFNTIQLIQHGGKELNPFMDILINMDIQTFVATKFALTGLGLLVLVAYRGSTFIKWLKSQHLLYGVFAFYTVLIAYQSLLVPDYMFGFVFPI